MAFKRCSAGVLHKADRRRQHGRPTRSAAAGVIYRLMAHGTTTRTSCGPDLCCLYSRGFTPVAALLGLQYYSSINSMIITSAIEHDMPFNNQLMFSVLMYPLWRCGFISLCRTVMIAASIDYDAINTVDTRHEHLTPKGSCYCRWYQYYY